MGVNMSLARIASRALPALALTTVVAGTLAALGAATAVAAPAAEAGSRVTIAPAAQDYYWTWSDGSQKSHRTFTQTEYGIQPNLPKLVVTVEPAKPRHYINLEFKEDGKWVLENKVATNSKGVANIDINPYCANESWCDGTYTYRLKVGSQYAILKLTYSEK